MVNPAGEAEGEIIGGFGSNDPSQRLPFLCGDGVGGVAGLYHGGGIEDRTEEPIGWFSTHQFEIGTELLSLSLIAVTNGAIALEVGLATFGITLRFCNVCIPRDDFGAVARTWLAEEFRYRNLQFLTLLHIPEPTRPH